MARGLLTLFGLIFLGLGIWLTVIWWSAILVVLQGILVIVLILLGLAMFIFGISEMAGTKKRME